jgi:hypothetical protein
MEKGFFEDVIQDIMYGEGLEELRRKKLEPTVIRLV